VRSCTADAPCRPAWPERISEIRGISNSKRKLDQPVCLKAATSSFVVLSKGVRDDYKSKYLTCRNEIQRNSHVLKNFSAD